MVIPEISPDLREVVAHVEAAYPNEGCGVLIHGPQGWVTRPMENAQDREHARDPARFPRTARTAYFFDPKEMLRVQLEVDHRGEEIKCVFHSHADVGAYFSEEDRAKAVVDGEPLWPGMSYLVVAVDAGKATAAKLFWWDSGEFHEKSVPLPPR